MVMAGNGIELIGVALSAKDTVIKRLVHVSQMPRMVIVQAAVDKAMITNHKRLQK